MLPAEIASWNQTPNKLASCDNVLHYIYAYISAGVLYICAGVLYICAGVMYIRAGVLYIRAEVLYICVLE